MNPRLGWLSLLFLALPAHGGGAPPSSTSELRLEIGASASLTSADSTTAEPTLTFLEVVSDNRCPEGVNCFVAGEGVVRLEAHQGERREEIELRIPPGGQDRGEVFGYELQGRLLPGTRADRRIEPEEYVLELDVRR